MKKLLLWAGFVVLPVLRAEVPPFWWLHSTTTIYEAGTTPGNLSPANAGQLKNVARKAKHYLDRSLASQGGSGFAITQVVMGFEPHSNQSYTPAQLLEIRKANFQPINLGQAKAVAKVFYDRLLAVGFNTRESLIYNGYPAGWSTDYPWTVTTGAQNFMPLNLGQLKLLFSFAFDSDHNNLDDNWEIQFFGAIGQNPGLDPDLDGLTNLQENNLWSDPLTWNDPETLDTNGDGILDSVAATLGYSVTDLDVDNDGIVNSVEYALGTNPFWFDTDGDGMADGLDQFPLDPSQSQFPPPGGDTTPPMITLFTPENATLLP